MRSLWCQGVAGTSRREYFRLLWKGDPTQPSSYLAMDTPLSSLIEHAREAMLRAEPQRPIAEVDAWARSLRERIEGQAATAADFDSLYRWSRE